MRDRKKFRVRRPAAVRSRETSGQSKHDYSQELMDLVVEAARSRDLPVFLASFAARATEMLKAEWGGVGEILGSKLELYSQGTEFPGGESERAWVLENVKRKRQGLEVLPLGNLAKFCAFYPIYASDGELMGTVCLVRRKANFSPKEDELLAVLGSHAALSMEKVRRFAQLERSKKQWVEDIDAISDYIAVHDQRGRIVRTNRSLATHLGRSPVALVGEPMISL